MGKQYAYCPRGFVEMIEKRTSQPQYTEDPYPIKNFYHGSLLPFFKEIPESQQNEIRLLWIWDESECRFVEPQIGQEVDGEIYIGTIPKERIYELLQNDLKLQQAYIETMDQLTTLDDTAIQMFEFSEQQNEINNAQDESLIELYELAGSK